MNALLKPDREFAPWAFSNESIGYIIQHPVQKKKISSEKDRIFSDSRIPGHRAAVTEPSRTEEVIF